MKSRLSLYLDKMVSSQIPESLREHLQGRGLISEDGLNRVSFCGLFMINGQLNIFLPRSSDYDNFSEGERVAVASLMMKAVEKYGRDRVTKIDLRDDPDGNKGLSQLSLIKKLLDDYRQHGIYSRRKIIRKLNGSRPDWKKTISRSVSYQGANGAPIYIDVHCTQKKYSTDTEISLIHAEVIKRIDYEFSWLLTGRLGMIAPSLLDYPSPVINTLHQIRLLKTELNQVYAERDIRLIKSLIGYLEGFGGNSTTPFVAGVRDFHFAWEHMLREVLDSKVELNSKLPTPTYITNEGVVLSSNEKGMRTDIILEDKQNNILAVIDAKYYEATQTENAPGWPDLVKQFFYARAVKLIKPASTVRNYFVFPSKAGRFSQVKMRDRDQMPGLFHDQEFPPVDCVYVCPLKVLGHYTTGKKMHSLTQHFLS